MNSKLPTNIICGESFHGAAAQLAKYWSGTYSVLRAPNEMAEPWMEKRLAAVMGSLPQDFLTDYEHWKRFRHDEDGGCVLHVLVDAFVPECMLGVVLARIDENDLTTRAWAIPVLE